MITTNKLNRVRTGCWTCKKRHRKCDEAKPECNNCTKSKRKCEGYELRLCFDVDDKRNKKRLNGKSSYGFIGRPKVHKILKTDEKVHHTLPMPAKIDSSVSPSISGLIHPYTPIGDLPGPIRANTGYSEPISSTPIRHSGSLHSGPGVPPSLGAGPGSMYCGPHPGHGLMSTGPGPHLVGPASRSSLSSSNVMTPSSAASPPGTYKIPTDSFQQLSFGLFEDLEYLLNNSADLDAQAYIEPTLDPVAPETDLKLTYQEENMMLKHFFQKLLPLLDAHPNSPWPDLALKYCDFNIARSCFISLACMHLYESKKNKTSDTDINYNLSTLQEYYKRGMEHINSTMELLVSFVNDKKQLSLSAVDKKKQISAFVILLLINVHILFTVLEEGKSALVRFYYTVFASICNDKLFFDNIVRDNEKKKSLVVVLSWYDTVSAIVSPDRRLPVCLEEWYGGTGEVSSLIKKEKGTSVNGISTAKMMGCPGQIFQAMARVCYLRHVIHHQKPVDDLHKQYQEIKHTLVNYRDYVLYDPKSEDGYFASSVRAAQCWSLAVYITLERVVKLPSYENRIRQLVHEFIDIYSGMVLLSPLVTQMVWPVYAVGCECRSSYEQDKLLEFMDTLYENVQMGTLASLRHIVKKVWELGISQEEYLEGWLVKGVDYLPL